MQKSASVFKGKDDKLNVEQLLVLRMNYVSKVEGEQTQRSYYYITCHEVITTATSNWLLIFPRVSRSQNNENKVFGAHAERH